MGNDNKVQVEGKWIVVVKTKFGKKFINDMMFIPSWKQNLISIGQLIRKRYYIIFYDEKYLIYDKNLEN